MKRFLSLLILPLLLASCTEMVDPMTDVVGPANVVYATVEGFDMPATKVYADEDLKVLWNADDRISIFDKTTYNYQYKFLGKDGDTAGEFEKQPVSGFITGGNIDHKYAVYPYVKGNKMNNKEEITVTLPAEQSYKEHSFGIGDNTMVSVSDDDFLSFKNVGGYLSLRLYGGVSVSKITLKGNNGEAIAGKAVITIAAGEAPVLKMDESATTEISLVCNPAVVLGATADQYTDFWFVIPPVTFANGFQITVVDDQNKTFTKQTSKAFVVKRNQLDWMNALQVVTE